VTDVGVKYYYVVVTNNDDSVNGTQTADLASSVATVTVNAPQQTLPSIGITLDPPSLDFGSLEAGYTRPAARGVTITNTGEESINDLIFTLSDANFTTSATSTGAISIGGTFEFSVRPAAELPVGTYSATVTLTDDSGAIVGTLPVRFTVTAVTPPPASDPGTGGGGGGSAPAPIPEETEEDIEDEETPLADTVDGRTPPAGFVTERVAYINGYADGTIRPNGSLTRAEVSVMLYRLLTGTDKDDPAATAFTDVTAGKWYSQAVAYLTQKGILTGYSDGSFNPNAQITRAEFAAIISRLDTNAGNADAAAKFNDVPESHWAFALIGNAIEKGWLGGYPDGTFKPQNVITRAEAVTAINNILNRDLSAMDIPADVPVYKDLDASHWAYAALIEATYNWPKAADADATEDENAEATDNADADTTENSDAAEKATTE
jgi:hypothetical protein